MLVLGEFYCKRLFNYVACDARVEYITINVAGAGY